MPSSNLLEMNNVGIVVENMDESIVFFSEIGLLLEGRTTVEGEWAGRLTGLNNQIVEIAMMVTPDGHHRIELSKFIVPLIIEDHRRTPVNALGYLRIMFKVENIELLISKLTNLGAQIEGEVVVYEHKYKLCYIRSTEGILIGLAEELPQK